MDDFCIILWQRIVCKFEEFEVLTDDDDLREEVDPNLLLETVKHLHHDPPVPIHGKPHDPSHDDFLETAQLVVDKGSKHNNKKTDL